MPGSTTRAVIATALFAGVHTLLASDAAKGLAARLIGRRNRDRYYRAAYNAQALASTAALFLYVRACTRKDRRDGRLAYDIHGPAAYAMRAGQALALIQLARCVWAVGPLNFLGLNDAAPDESTTTIEAQGPARLRDGGALILAGPFRTRRHPTNFWSLVLLALQPRMTRPALAFSVIANLYFYLGSVHQDQRLSRAWGDAYRRYKAAVPFFFPATAISTAARSIPSSIPRNTT